MVLFDKRLSAVDARVFAALSAFAWKLPGQARSETVRPSVGTLARMVGKHRNTVSACLARLEECGYIKRTLSLGGRGAGATNRYQLLVTTDTVPGQGDAQPTVYESDLLNQTKENQERENQTQTPLSPAVLLHTRETGQQLFRHWQQKIEETVTDLNLWERVIWGLARERPSSGQCERYAGLVPCGRLSVRNTDNWRSGHGSARSELTQNV